MGAVRNGPTTPDALENAATIREAIAGGETDVLQRAVHPRQMQHAMPRRPGWR